MGALVYLFNQVNEHFTLVDALKLFKKSVEEIELCKSFYKRTEIERQFYKEGLSYLQYYNKRLCFFEPKEMINYKTSAFYKKRRASQISKTPFFSLSEAASHSAELSAEKDKSPPKKRKK